MKGHLMMYYYMYMEVLKNTLEKQYVYTGVRKIAF